MISSFSSFCHTPATRQKIQIQHLLCQTPEWAAFVIICLCFTWTFLCFTFCKWNSLVMAVSLTIISCEGNFHFGISLVHTRKLRQTVYVWIYFHDSGEIKQDWTRKNRTSAETVSSTFTAVWHMLAHLFMDKNRDTKITICLSFHMQQKHERNQRNPCFAATKPLCYWTKTGVTAKQGEHLLKLQQELDFFILLCNLCCLIFCKDDMLHHFFSTQFFLHKNVSSLWNWYVWFRCIQSVLLFGKVTKFGILTVKFPMSLIHIFHQ